MRSLPFYLAFVASLPLPVLARSGDSQEIVLGPGFTPHPLRVATTSGKTSVDLAGSGHPCQGLLTSGEPALDFRLTAKLEGLAVTFSRGHEIGHGFVVFPNKRILCTEGLAGRVITKDWPAGTYHVYFLNLVPGLPVEVGFEQPERIRLEAPRATAALPTYELSPDGALNPFTISATGKVSIPMKDAGLKSCIDPRYLINPDRADVDFVTPLARLNAKEDMASVKLSSMSRLILEPQEPNVKCVRSVPRGRSWSGSHLKAGVYTIYAVLGRGEAPGSYFIEVDDTARPLVFPRAQEVTPVNDLSKPQVVQGQVRPPAVYWPQRDSCQLPTASEPDFYLVRQEPLTQVTLTLLWSKEPQYLRVYGPLERLKPGDGSQCAGKKGGPEDVVLDLMEGTYAVWVGSGQQSGSDFHVMLRRPTTEIDPFEPLVQPPTDLTLEERSIHHFYPALGQVGSGHGGTERGRWDEEQQSFRLFTTAPEQVFVYARTDFDPPGRRDPPEMAEVPVKGEPLLVSGRPKEGWISVITFDGHSFAAPDALLSTERPAEVHFRALPKLTINYLPDAIAMAGPEDQPAIAKHNVLQSRYGTCYENYMSRNDPTWLSSTKLYHLTYKRGRVLVIENYSKVLAARAWTRCGGARIEQSEDALEKLLAAHREKRRLEQFLAVKKRFGL